MPFLGPRLGDGQQTTALLAGAVLICLLGIADDKWELDALTKLAKPDGGIYDQITTKTKNQ